MLKDNVDLLRTMDTLSKVVSPQMPLPKKMEKNQLYVTKIVY